MVTSPSARNFLNNLEILPVSEVILANRYVANNTNRWMLLDFYKIAPDYPMNTLVYGQLKQEATTKDLQVYVRQTTGSRRRNLEGLRMPCGLVVSVEED